MGAPEPQAPEPEAPVPDPPLKPGRKRRRRRVVIKDGGSAGRECGGAEGVESASENKTRGEDSDTGESPVRERKGGGREEGAEKEVAKVDEEEDKRDEEEALYETDRSILLTQSGDDDLTSKVQQILHRIKRS